MRLRCLTRSIGGRRTLGTPYVGTLASKIVADTAVGDHGPGLLYPIAQLAGNAGKQLRLRVTAWPAAGSLFVFEDGSLLFSSAPSGTYTVGFDWYADDVLGGSDSATITLNSASSSATGATLNGSSSLSAGSATGNALGMAPGATLNGPGALQAGAAQGNSVVNGNAPGAPLMGSSALNAGAATGGHDGNAPGSALNGAGTLQTGIATGEAVEYVRAPDGNSRPIRTGIATASIRTRTLTPPMVEPVTVEEMIDQCRLDDDTQPLLLSAFISAAREMAEAETGRAVGVQTREALLDAFAPAIVLRGAPVLAVQSIRFIDPEGVERWLDPQDVFLDRDSEPGYLMPARGKLWPATADQANAVRVRFTCGYAAGTVPPGIKTWIMLAAAALYANREAFTMQQAAALPDRFWHRFLDPHRLYEVS